MNLFVLGLNCRDDLAIRALDRLVDIANLYPQLDPDTRWSWEDGNGVFAGSVHTPRFALGSRRYVHRDEQGVTFFDGTAIDKLGEIAPHDAGALQEAWDGLADRLEGQYVAIRIWKSPARVGILNDFLGMRQVYYRRIEEGCVFSSSVELLAGLGERCGLDSLGVSSFLCWGWASGDRTLVRDVRVLPPGQYWTWSARDGREPSRTTHYPPTILARLPQKRLTRRSIDLLADRLADQVTGLTQQYEEVSCGLTAGRDSRLLAALLSSRNVPVRYVTYVPDESSSEARIACQVAEALHLSHEVSVPPDEDGGIVAEWEEISKDLVRQNDGMVTLWQVAVMLNRKNRIERLDVSLGGHGGEISRGFYLEPQRLLLPSSEAGIHRFMLARLIGSDAGLATAEAKVEARAFVAEFVDQKLREGYAPDNIPDAFYTYDRVSRWAATVGMRPTLPLSEVFLPFCTRPYVELAFSMRLRDRYAEALQLRGIPQLAPALARVPFDKGTSGTMRIAKDLVRCAARLDPFGLLERRRQAGDSNVWWAQTLLPRLRDECLEQESSPLWDFVDRGAFERTTAEVSADAFLPAEAVLRVATLFYYYQHRCGST